MHVESSWPCGSVDYLHTGFVAQAAQTLAHRYYCCPAPCKLSTVIPTARALLSSVDSVIIDNCSTLEPHQNRESSPKKRKKIDNNHRSRPVLFLPLLSVPSVGGVVKNTPAKNTSRLLYFFWLLVCCCMLLYRIKSMIMYGGKMDKCWYKILIQNNQLRPFTS